MASKIKIRIKVIDDENNFRLWLPAIPFWLITSLTSLALKFKPMILENINNLGDDGRMFLEQLDSRMIKEFIREFKRYGKFNLVDISTGNGTEVKISII